MATNDITIGLQGLTPITVDSGPPPAIIINEWSGNYPTKSPITQSSVNGYSFDGSGIVNGPGHTTKYTWAFETNLNADKANDLYTLWEYQQTNKVPLRLLDEVNLLPAAPTPVRPLVQTFSKSYGTPNWTFGYGAFDVWLNLPNNWNSFYGNLASLGQSRVITFTATEA